MAFAARYLATCAECKQPVTVGQLIKWNLRERGIVYHANCTTPDAQPTPDTPSESEASPMPTATYTDSDGVTTPLENVKDYDSAASMVKVPEPIVDTPKPALPAPDGVMAVFAAALLPHIEEKLKVKVDAPQFAALESELRAAVAKLSAPLRIEVSNPATDTTKVIDNAHKSFADLLYYISKRHHTYLYGDPGSGKSTAAKQAADSLGWKYGYISLNPQTPESRLLGYKDATGQYHATVFQDIYENGGVFCIDEMDNASPALLTTLNGCLENGHAAFPHGIIKRHDNFVVVGTGNTTGHGANHLFPDRRPFDAAFAERFTFINWEYDENMERNAALAINPKCDALVQWVRTIRRFAKTEKIRLIVSPRVTFKLAEYAKDGKFAKHVDGVLFKGLGEEQKTRIMNAAPLPNLGGK